MAYVRPEAKAHGRSQQIEGYIPTGSKVVVIEDLISTGGSSIKAVAALEKEGIEVLSVLAIFTYELEKATTNFNDANIKLHTLSDYSTLIEVAQASNQISETDVELLKSWRANPQAFGL